jgi:hypothetical protein
MLNLKTYSWSLVLYSNMNLIDNFQMMIKILNKIRNRHQIPFVFAIISTLILVSCEKQAFDYRNKYLGNWEFEVSYSHEVFNATQGFHDTTEINTYLGEIKLGSENNKISFESQKYTKDFTIDKSGDVIPTPGLGPLYSESGGFEGKDIFKYYFHHQSGGTPHKYQTIYISGTRN